MAGTQPLDRSILVLEQVIVAMDLMDMITEKSPGSKIGLIDSPSAALDGLLSVRPDVVLANLDWLGAHAAVLLARVHELGLKIVLLGSRYTPDSDGIFLPHLDYPLTQDAVSEILRRVFGAGESA